MLSPPFPCHYHFKSLVLTQARVAKISGQSVVRKASNFRGGPKNNSCNYQGNNSNLACRKVRKMCSFSSCHPKQKHNFFTAGKEDKQL